MTRMHAGTEDTTMNKHCAAIVITLALGLLLLGCSAEATSQVPATPPLDQMPLALAGRFFTSGYELAGYYELDTGSDGPVGAMAVLTVRLPVTEASAGVSRVLLFGQHRGEWSLEENQKLDGVNARAEYRDVTGDDSPELLVLTEEVDRQLGYFVTPLRYTDYLTVFTYTPELRLAKLGTFSSSLEGVLRPHTTVEEWQGQPAIQTAQDLPPVGGSLWRPFRIETLAWDGEAFASVQVQEQRRISPLVSWLVRQNAPWAAAFLALGAALSVATTLVTRRWKLQKRWVILALVCLLVTAGVALSLVEQWLCVPALVLVGLAGCGIGRQVTHRLVNAASQETEVGDGE
jgi:hypothetical protein